MPSTAFAAAGGYPAAAGRYFNACADGTSVLMTDASDASAQLERGYYAGPMVQHAARTMRTCEAGERFIKRLNLRRYTVKVRRQLRYELCYMDDVDQAATTLYWAFQPLTGVSTAGLLYGAIPQAENDFMAVNSCVSGR